MKYISEIKENESIVTKDYVNNAILEIKNLFDSILVNLDGGLPSTVYGQYGIDGGLPGTF